MIVLNERGTKWKVEKFGGLESENRKTGVKQFLQFETTQESTNFCLLWAMLSSIKFTLKN